MAPQKTETVELPDITEPVQETDGWMFPKSWSDEDKRDWLITHPGGHDTKGVEAYGVETVTISDPPANEHYEDCDPECDGDRTDPDQYGGENGDASNMDEPEELSEREVISALKADGYYAAAIAVPPELKDTVNSDNYDPRQFFLVHSEVWNEFVSAVHEEATLGLENKELRKRVNALTRGMRKVNKHWSATKRELKSAVRAYNELYQLSVEGTKRKDIFATRLARRLRKARAGRDKRERQLNQAQMTIKAQDHIIEKQDEYISHLEKLMTGDPQVSAAWRSTL